MLKEIDLKHKISKQDYDTAFDAMSVKLGALERKIRDAGIPVLIVVEGWRGSMRGQIINKVLQSMDPRGFSVFSASKVTEAQKKLPFFMFYWRHLPPKGHINIHHRGWYFLKNEHEVGDPHESDRWYNVSYDSINTFEKELTDDGYLIIKIFTHLSKKQQKIHMDKINKIYDSSWEDMTPGGIEGADYKAYGKVYEEMFVKTDTLCAPWHIVPVEDTKTGIIATFEVLIDALEKALKRKPKKKVSVPKPKADNKVPHILDKYDLNKSVESTEVYKTTLKEYHKKLQALQLELYKVGVSTIMGFEGWDAGGKGGAIKRFTAPLDPLGYSVNPVSAPNDWEKQFNYLWRFWQHIPMPGEIAIFDRTWYGRVLVERVEGFASPQEWKRAYQEINDMEEQWANQNIVVNKFWLQIDKDEQYRRFQAREGDKAKQWKITDEDWRNREKWQWYEEAVNEMLYRTDTLYAPWTVIEANNKEYARLKVFKTMLDRYEKVLKDKGATK